MSKEPWGNIALGAFFLLLAIGAAMGAVSLGVVNATPNTTGGAYLVYSPLYEFLAVVLAGLGGYFLYNSGKMKDSATRKKPITP
jgi:hypothetical protein